MEQAEIRDGYEAMDFARVAAMLAGANWCKGIGRPEVERGAQNSALNVGAFVNGVQVGYARAISDKTRFAYIVDVYVEEEYRGRGLARQMLQHIQHHPEMQSVYQWMLLSRADELYSQLGFGPLTKRDEWMEIWNTRPR